MFDWFRGLFYQIYGYETYAGIDIDRSTLTSPDMDYTVFSTNSFISDNVLNIDLILEETNELLEIVAENTLFM